MTETFYSFLGISVDVGHMGFSLILVNLFSFVFSFIPPKLTTVRHLFSPLACLMTYYFLFRDNLPWHITADIIVTYSLLKVFPRNKLTPWIITTSLLLHLGNVQWLGTSVHTAPMMMTAIKLSLLAWDVHDNSVASPSLISTFGYTFFFPGFFVGPPCGYEEYVFNIYFLPHPGYKMEALKKAGVGIACAITWYLLMDFDYYFCIEPQFQDYTMPSKILFLQLAGFSSRLKYYIAWKFSESAYILSGLGFKNHIEGELDFSGIENVDIVGIETSTSLHGFWKCWNKRTSSWLRECIYRRLPLSKTSSSLVTFAVSAFWHGIFPGYYLTFITASLFGMVGNKLHHLKISVPFLSEIFAWVITNFAINYAGAPFVLLDLSSGLMVWREFYFIPHIVAGLFMLM